MFRFLLEAYGHTLYFTVLERDAALLRLVFSPHCAAAAREALAQMAWSLPFSVEAWPAEEQAAAGGGCVVSPAATRPARAARHAPPAREAARKKTLSRARFLL